MKLLSTTKKEKRKKETPLSPPSNPLRAITDCKRQSSLINA